MKKTTLPELIAPKPAPWHHATPNPDPSAPLADRKTRQIRDAIADTEAAHAQRLTALVASRYNSRQPQKRAALTGATRELWHAAENLRNRYLAQYTSTGKDLPRPRYHIPEQLAAHHAHAIPHNYAHQIASLAHHPGDRQTYLATLSALGKHQLANHTTRVFADLDNYLNQLRHNLIHNTRRLHRYADQRLTNAELTALQIAQTLDRAGQTADDARKRDNQQQHTPGNGPPARQPGAPRWRAVHPSKPDRPLTHTGRLGRRRIATNAGKNPNRIHNYCGDPMRRIFTRNTRGTRALVIVDSSGSMSLTTDELNAILNTSQGATVVAYSHRYRQHPNTYLLAHNGRKVRDIPQHLGASNEVDLTAAVWAVDNYARTGAPIVWITDGHVTGLNERQHPNLYKQCADYAHKLGIIISPNYETAIQDLKALSTGKRPPQRLDTFAV